MNVPEFDWCLVGKAKFDGFLLHQLTELVKRIFPTIMSHCPVSQVEVGNLTFPSHKFFSFMPTGIYKFIVKVRFDENGSNLYNLTGIFLFEAYKDKINA